MISLQREKTDGGKLSRPSGLHGPYRDRCLSPNARVGRVEEERERRVVDLLREHQVFYEGEPGRSLLYRESLQASAAVLCERDANRHPGRAVGRKKSSE